MSEHEYPELELPEGDEPLEDDEEKPLDLTVVAEEEGDAASVPKDLLPDG